MSSTDPIIQAADKAIARVIAQREEILEAFVAKYGADPDQVEQVDQQMKDGSICWFVRLAQPEPEGVTDDRLEDQFLNYSYVDDFGNELMELPQFLKAVRAVLARYGNKPITPILLAERQPIEADCDDQGRCWMCDNHGNLWELTNKSWDNNYWLPYWALPVPEPIVEN